MDEIHVHKTKKSICAHFAESPCSKLILVKKIYKSKKATYKANQTDANILFLIKFQLF